MSLENLTPIEEIDISNYSERIIHETSVDFVKRIVRSQVHIMQYDNNLPIVAAKLYRNGHSYALPESSVVKIRGSKKDHTIVYKPVLGCDSSRTIVYFEVDNQMSYFEGMYTPILEVTINGKMAGSSYVYIKIDRNPVQNSDIESQSEYPDLLEAVQKAESAAQAAEDTAESISDSLQQIATNTADIAELKQAIINAKIFYDTKANWDAQPTLRTESNTIYVYTDAFTYNDGSKDVQVAGIKIGDGNAYLIDKAFITDYLANQILQLYSQLQTHINDNTRHITAEERTKWNNKANYEVLDINETLILNRN